MGWIRLPLTARKKRWSDAPHRGVEQTDRVLPILQARDADGRVRIAMRYGNRYSRDAGERFMDRARICASASRLSELVWNPFGFGGFFQKAD
jgi:hypothetical protein